MFSSVAVKYRPRLYPNRPQNHPTLPQCRMYVVKRGEKYVQQREYRVEDEESAFVNNKLKQVIIQPPPRWGDLLFLNDEYDTNPGRDPTNMNEGLMVFSSRRHVDAIEFDPVESKDLRLPSDFQVWQEFPDKDGIVIPEDYWPLERCRFSPFISDRVHMGSIAHDYRSILASNVQYGMFPFLKEEQVRQEMKEHHFMDEEDERMDEYMIDVLCGYYTCFDHPVWKKRCYIVFIPFLEMQRVEKHKRSEEKKQFIALIKQFFETCPFNPDLHPSYSFIGPSASNRQHYSIWEDNASCYKHHTHVPLLFLDRHDMSSCMNNDEDDGNYDDDDDDE